MKYFVIILTLFLFSCNSLETTKKETKVREFILAYRKGYNDAMQGMSDYLDNVTQNKEKVARGIQSRHRQAAIKYAIKKDIYNEKISNYIVKTINWMDK